MRIVGASCDGSLDGRVFIMILQAENPYILHEEAYHERTQAQIQIKGSGG